MVKKELTSMIIENIQIAANKQLSYWNGEQIKLVGILASFMLNWSKICPVVVYFIQKSSSQSNYRQTPSRYWY